MIIENGTIEVKNKTAGGIDPRTGYAIPSSEAQWLTPVPCQWSVTNFSYLARTAEGEHYVKASYSILIEQVYGFAPKQIRLTNAAGEVMGEFSVVRQEELDAVGQTRIYV